MQSGDSLEREAQELGSWLRAHSDDFPPLRIVRVDPSLDFDSDGEPAIRLTVVLEDPEDPSQGWPVDAAFRLIGAVQDEASEEHTLQALVHLQAVSDEAA